MLQEQIEAVRFIELLAAVLMPPVLCLAGEPAVKKEKDILLLKTHLSFINYDDQLGQRLVNSTSFSKTLGEQRHYLALGLIRKACNFW